MLRMGCLPFAMLGAYQRGQSKSDSRSPGSPFVGDLCSARGAKVSRNRHVRLVVEGEGEMESADAGYVLEGQVDVPSVSAHDANVSPSAMAEPHHKGNRCSREARTPLEAPSPLSHVEGCCAVWLCFSGL